MATYSNLDSLQLGTLVQILFTNSVQNQLSADFRDFDWIAKKRITDSLAREIRFMFNEGYGPGAIQAGNPGARGTYPAAQQSNINEYTAKLKKYLGTIDVDQDVWERAMKSPNERYMEPIALEVENKSIAAKRRVAADWHADGTGVLATVASSAAYDTTNDKQVITLKSGADDRGHVGLCEIDDLIMFVDNDGTANDPSGTTTNFYCWKIIDKSREDNTITVQPVTSAYAVDTDITDAGVADGDVIYRVGDPLLSAVGGTSVTSSLDLTAAITDYGTAGFVLAGLDSLVEDDGRTIHGITLSGAAKATHKDLANSEALDTKYIQQLLSQVKVRAGERYKWNAMVMSPEAHDALIDSREADRRFQTWQDNTRGTNVFGYVHGTDRLESVTSEYNKPAKLYLLPESKEGNKVFEYRASDFETVKGGDMDGFRLKPSSSGGFEEGMVQYLRSYGTIICNHAAAVGVLKGFTTD